MGGTRSKPFLKEMEERYRLAAEGIPFERMIAQVSDHFGLSVKELQRPGKHPQRGKARSVAAYLAVRKLGMTGTSVGRLLGIRQSAVSRAVSREEKLVDEAKVSFL